MIRLLVWTVCRRKRTVPLCRGTKTTMTPLVSVLTEKEMQPVCRPARRSAELTQAPGVMAHGVMAHGVMASATCHGARCHGAGFYICNKKSLSDFIKCSWWLLLCAFSVCVRARACVRACAYNYFHNNHTYLFLFFIVNSRVERKAPLPASRGMSNLRSYKHQYPIRELTIWPTT